MLWQLEGLLWADVRLLGSNWRGSRSGSRASRWGFHAGGLLRRGLERKLDDLLKPSHVLVERLAKPVESSDASDVVAVLVHAVGGTLEGLLSELRHANDELLELHLLNDSLVESLQSMDHLLEVGDDIVLQTTISE